MTQLVKSSARTLDILELFAAHPGDLSLSEMVKQLNIPISSMHGLVLTLKTRGYLVRDPVSLCYRMGPKFAQLAAVHSTYVELLAHAAPVMDRIGAACKEAVTMSVLQGDKIVFISNRPAISIVQAVNAIGTSLPAHATGSGKIMLAYLPGEEFERTYPNDKLPWLMANTISTKVELKQAILEARRRGCAYDEEESEEGVWAVAGCIRNSAGRPMAALSVVVPVIRVQANDIQYWTSLVIEGAAEISSKLGFVTSTE